MKHAILCLLLFELLPACRQAPTREVAEKEALDWVRRYAVEEGLPFESFAFKALYSSQGFPWTFEYVSQTEPRHTLFIMFEDDGDTELSRRID